jgi:hypothetical protein
MHLGLFFTRAQLRRVLVRAVAGAALCAAAAAHAASAPTISGTPPSAVTAGSTYSFQPGTEASNGDQIRYFGINNKPAWATFNTKTGLLTGTPTSAQVGTYSNIQIRGSTAVAWALTSVFSITVKASGSTVVAPTVSLSTSSTSISSGASATLSWSSSNATGCTASGGWSGSEATSGSASTGALSTTTTYTLTCSGSGGSASQSVTVSVATVTAAGGSSCSSSSGGLTLQAKVVRTTGVSPLLVFFDATGTSDTTTLPGANNAFQDVSYSWNFGDTGASGSGTWAYGANAGHNSKNSATGAVAAHLYVTNGADTSYPVTVTAYDGTQTASCTLGVTAYDPVGANGFAGSATTCVAAASTPAAGSGGCPAGAAVMQQSNMGTALSSAFGSGKRVLFRCGDTFTGSYGINATVNKASIGAYGSCVNGTSGRPIFQNSGGTTLNFDNNSTSTYPTDIRVTDIDFEDGTQSITAIGNYVGGGDKWGNVQITLYNLNCGGAAQCFQLNNATQSGMIASTTTGCGGSGTQCVFWNYGENNCLNGSSALYCGNSAYSQSYYQPIWYNAILGNGINGAGLVNSDNGRETFRVSACRMCVFTNNTFENANDVGATFKLHDGNTAGSAASWLGQYVEYIEISDNYFTGTSGSQLIENAPQNNLYDERLRMIVFERNLIHATGASKMLVSAVNETLRNNAWYVESGDGNLSDYNMQISQRGVEPVASGVEVYNNTCYALTAQSGCAGFISGDGANAAGINSWAYNNLFYNGGKSSATITNNGSGNTVSNNTSNSAANPLLMNGSGSFSVISDFEPTQNYSGGAEVPVWYDAMGVAWSPTWSFGAIKP